MTGAYPLRDRHTMAPLLLDGVYVQANRVQLTPLSFPFLVLIVVGCGHTETASTPTSARAATAVPRTRSDEALDRAAHMQASFWMATVARDAVISGDLATTKRAAHALAEHDYAGTLPADWRHWVAQMQLRAEEVAMAPDLPSAAQSVAALGLSCGDCHAQKRRTPDLEGGEALAWKEPPEDLRERMYRHALGAEQLWLGLIQPSERMWLDGTLTLTRAPLERALRDGERIAPELAAKIEAIRGLATRARAARSHPERAAIYGELIGRCADCHFVAGVEGSER